MKHIRTLLEMDRQPNAPHQGRLVCREAVRAVILRGHQLLLVHSSVNGDYKFPGGGTESGECHESALVREVAEEIGGCITSSLEPFGKAMEYDFPLEKDFDSFCMTSYYFCCEVGPELGDQQLDEYEARMKMKPVWVDIDEAISNNNELIASGKKVMCWVRRETRMLEIVRDELMEKTTFQKKTRK